MCPRDVPFKQSDDIQEIQGWDDSGLGIDSNGVIIIVQ